MSERYVQINKLRNMRVNCRRTDSLGILMRQIYRRSSFNHVKTYNIVQACNEWVFHLMYVEKNKLLLHSLTTFGQRNYFTTNFSRVNVQKRS